MPPSLRPALHEGAFWLFLGSGSQKLLGLLAGIALARLLIPSDFGLFALAAVAYELAALFDGLGTTQYIVAARTAEPDLDDAHFLNVAAAVLLAILIIAAAPGVAWFFGEPRLAHLLPVLAAALPLGSLGAVQGALLQRELRLGLVARRRLVVNLGALGTSVALAAAGLGVWALVIPVPLRSAANSWMNRQLHTWRPSRGPRQRGSRAVLDYGRHILGGRLADYLARQMDNAAVGRMLGAAPLGIYDFAYQAAMMPLRWGGDLANRLAFPAIASHVRSQGASADPRPILEASRWIAYLAGFLAGGLVVVAPEWVEVLYGPRWMETIPLLRALAPAAMAVLLTRPLTAWMETTGREAWPARARTATLPLVAMALWICVPRGVLAVAVAMSGILIGQSLLLIAAALVAGAAPAASWLRVVGAALLPSVLMLAGLVPAAMWVAPDTPVSRLFVLIPVGAALFVAASSLLARRQLRELLAVVRSPVRRAG